MIDIKEKLLKLQDKEYKKFQNMICTTSKYEIIGVRMPELRKISKQIIKDDYKLFLKKNKIVYYEEEMLMGLVIANANMTFDETCKYLEKFIKIIDNWAVCDTICASLKITKNNLDKMWIFLSKYLDSNNEYEIRFVIVMYLLYYIDKKYLFRIFNIIENLKNESYYVKMSVAWLISIAYVKEKELTTEFLNNTHIDKWTYNKALQKIIESNRVSNDDKNIIRKMKR